MPQNKPHYEGHRQRLRERFRTAGPGAIADYELVELILFGAKPRGDVKPLAKELLHRFKTFGAIVAASESELLKVKGMGESSVTAFKVILAGVQKLMLQNLEDRPLLTSWKEVVSYCQVTMGHLTVEHLRLLFLDRQHKLIADEVQQQGTLDHTPVYVREIIKRALELSASGLILVHNHPSGDPTPSRSDITVTKEIQETAERLGIHVHDHIIVTQGSYTSLRAKGLM